MLFLPTYALTRSSKKPAEKGEKKYMQLLDYSRTEQMNLPALDEDHLSHLFSLAYRYCPFHSLNVLHHQRSITAGEKQALLPQGVFVQKTVTLRMAEHLFLVSGIGDFRLTRSIYQWLAEQSRLSRASAKQREINPPWLPARSATGLEEGMVSPFIPPAFSAAPFKAVVLLSLLPSLEEDALVGISLSLADSLLFPVTRLNEFIFAYYAQYHPTIPILEMPLPLSD